MEYTLQACRFNPDKFLHSTYKNRCVIPAKAGIHAAWADSQSSFATISFPGYLFCLMGSRLRGNDIKNLQQEAHAAKK